MWCCGRGVCAQGDSDVPSVEVLRTMCTVYAPCLRSFVALLTEAGFGGLRCRTLPITEHSLSPALIVVTYPDGEGSTRCLWWWFNFQESRRALRGGY